MKKSSVREKLRYLFDNTLSKGPVQLDDLEIVSLDTAKSIIVLAED